VHIQLAGKFLIASGLCWELMTFSSISSRAGWEILTFPLAFQAEQKELAEGTLETVYFLSKIVTTIFPKFDAEPTVAPKLL